MITDLPYYLSAIPSMLFSVQLTAVLPETNTKSLSRKTLPVSFPLSQISAPLLSVPMFSRLRSTTLTFPGPKARFSDALGGGEVAPYPSGQLLGAHGRPPVSAMDSPLEIARLIREGLSLAPSKACLHYHLPPLKRGVIPSVQPPYGLSGLTLISPAILLSSLFPRKLDAPITLTSLRDVLLREL